MAASLWFGAAMAGIPEGVEGAGPCSGAASVLPPANPFSAAASGSLWDFGAISGGAPAGDACPSCGETGCLEVEEVSGAYHQVCRRCGYVGEEDAQASKGELEVTVESRGSSGVRFVGGDAETQKKISAEVSGAGFDCEVLAPAVLNSLAGRTPASPLADSKVIARATEMLRTLLNTGKRPSVGGVEKFLAGCLFYASVECGGEGGSEAEIKAFVGGAGAIVAGHMGGGAPATKKSTGLVKSIGEVKKVYASTGLQATLPSSEMIDRVGATRAVREYFRPLEEVVGTPGAIAIKGMESAYRWAHAEVVKAWGAADAPFPEKVLADVEDALVGAVLDCRGWTQRTSVGENRNNSTHWAAFASIVLEAFAAMGESRTAPDDYYMGAAGSPTSGLLREPKYLRVRPEFGPAEAPKRMAVGVLRVAVAIGAAYKAKGLKKPRSRTGCHRRPFPPRWRVAALRKDSPTQAVKEFVEEIRRYRRDLNSEVLQRHGLYLPRETYWKERGLRVLGVLL
jgi:transcription initiation factor TFIIIB Brf1 subunit/transcription initiation factor TFIIB